MQAQQMIPPNVQIPAANQPPQPQIYEVNQMEVLNSCEKCSKCLTGNANIPLVVFTILMGSFLVMIVSWLFPPHFLCVYFFCSSFFDLIFAIFVWCRMAMKIEANTSSVKYGYLFFLNLLILSVITLSCPFRRIWNFVLFETILIALNNKQKKIKFFCCRIPGTWVIVFSLIYHFLLNSFDIIPIIITLFYALAYNKWLSQKLNISNEKVEKIESYCIINFLKMNFKTFISLQEAINKDKKQQPLVPNVNNSINMSFIPVNMYPNYYSGIIPNPQNPVQQFPPVQAAVNPPVVDINRAN